MQPHAERYSLSTLNRLGAPHGADYRLLSADGGDRDVLEGRVEQRSLAFGGLLVLSRVRALHAYEARSRPDFCLSLAWLDAGEAHLRTRRDGPLRMTGTTAVTMLETGDTPLLASHPAGPLLHGLNLSVRDIQGLGDERLQSRLSALRRAGRSRLAPWRVPPALRESLGSLLEDQWDGDLATLLWEGTALQLLAHALHALDNSPAPEPVSERDRRLLRRVRERLAEEPEAAHTLASLAALACMSPSTLRAKFPRVYGQSVFDCLREQRLERAGRYLREGATVQQAAHFVGYRHASNFTTAFRAHFGMPPGEWRRGRVPVPTRRP
ncbi:helix-turn-helix transcriptional regulator [Alloalcanivorax sp. C16-2]|uniref:helix-turn-helix transcriptional regulator n=1 Tax=Alloalcanivorax TaxID=3020832 RepID=UPI0019345DA3|nr:helix-turn-helix transcriptional regulator [Alloalcanivorax marinus]MBL7250024.1 helix-turn-helix transcriptional regulator [Alloalcanivorax marinus]